MGDEEAKDLPGNVPLMCYSLFLRLAHTGMLQYTGMAV
jgi:hypothetical protein